MTTMIDENNDDDDDVVVISPSSSTSFLYLCVPLNLDRSPSSPSVAAAAAEPAFFHIFSRLPLHLNQRPSFSSFASSFSSSSPPTVLLQFFLPLISFHFASSISNRRSSSLHSFSSCLYSDCRPSQPASQSVIQSADWTVI